MILFFISKCKREIYVPTMPLLKYIPIGPTKVSMGTVAELKKHKPAEMIWKASMMDKKISVVTQSP